MFSCKLKYYVCIPFLLSESSTAKTLETRVTRGLDGHVYTPEPSPALKRLFGAVSMLRLCSMPRAPCPMRSVPYYFTFTKAVLPRQPPYLQPVEVQIGFCDMFET